MKTSRLPSAGYLRKCFSYVKSTGQLRWNKRPRLHFVSDKEWKRWNGRFAGALAGSRMKSGHLRVYVDGQPYLGHRLIWKLVTRKEPKYLIDHRNVNGRDNRWRNLREVDDSQSVMNRRKFKNNTSGKTGVIWSPQHKQWRVGISVRKERIELGLYAEFDKAVAARIAGEQFYHGEYVGRA